MIIKITIIIIIIITIIIIMIIITIALFYKTHSYSTPLHISSLTKTT